MPGSSTTPGRSDLAMVRPKRVAFRTRNSVGTRGLALSRFIAVGMVIADHPPHRSEHALLTHSAPTSSM